MRWASLSLFLLLWGSACTGQMGDATPTTSATGGTSTSATTATSSATETGNGGAGGAGGAASLPCDAGFTFVPEPPESSQPLTVSFTDTEPLTFVDVSASGPGTATVQWDGLEGGGPYTWSWKLYDLTPGTWTLTFSAGQPQVELATCQRVVIDTGPVVAPPGASCDALFCGDKDKNDQLCTDSPCRVVGSKLANPSPCGPSKNDSPWQTLDNAGCVKGETCKLWCPYEKCSGCPNGT